MKYSLTDFTKKILTPIVLLCALFSCTNEPAKPSMENSEESTESRRLGLTIDSKGNRYIIDKATGDTNYLRTVKVTKSGSYTYSYDSMYVDVRPYVKLTDPAPTDPAPTDPVPGNYGTLIYSSKFDTQKELDPFGNNQIGNGSLSSTVYVSAPYSFKSVTANVSSGIRSEVQFPTSLTPVEGAIEYNVLYETIFQYSGHSLQFHPLTSGGSASPGLWHEGGKFVWVNWKGGTNTKYPTNFTIPRNKWMHCVLEYKFGSAGYLKFTIDGVVVLNRTGIQVGDGSGQYLKVGVNMWQSQASVVYYDNLKIWKKN